MTQANIFAVFTPAKGKADRLRELLEEQSNQVHQKENYAVRFLLTEEKVRQNPEFWLFETYTSEEGTNKHTDEPHFKSMIDTFESEGILAKPPVVKKTSTIAGFDLDRKVIVSSDS